MADNELWDRLLDLKTLKLGWHLARRDAKEDFLDLPFYTDVYAVRLERKLREIQRLLATERSRTLAAVETLVEVPKGTLAIRPGSVPTFADRIVLQSIIALIAPVIDPRISDAVYSYRVRDKKPDPRHRLFRESDVVDLPFLKSRTISRELDPFQSWYDAWPEFDEVSKRAFGEEGYNYLAVSDIAAYFENVQLLILRDQLLALLNGEAKISDTILCFSKCGVLVPSTVVITGGASHKERRFEL